MTEGWQLKPTAQQTRADRYYAVHVLGTLRDKRALRILLPLLGDQDIDYKVAWALGEIGDPSAIPALITALRAPSAHARVSVVDALSTLRAIDAIPALRALEHDDVVASNAGHPVLVSQRVLEADASLESHAHSAPVAQNKDGLRLRFDFSTSVN